MMRDVRESIHREMREGLANAWWSQVCDRAEDDGERHLPTFSHFLIVNKLLSLSLSLNKLLSLSLSLSLSLGWQVTRFPPYVRRPFPSKEIRRKSEKDDPGPPVVPGDRFGIRTLERAGR